MISNSHIGLPLDSITLTSGFNLQGRKHPVTGDVKQHKGDDLDVYTGQPVYAPEDGTWLWRPVSKSAGVYGMLVEPTGIVHRMLHLQSPGGAAGSTRALRQGEKIHGADNTGISTGSHLHWETWIPQGDTYVPVPPLATAVIRHPELATVLQKEMSSGGWQETKENLAYRSASLSLIKILRKMGLTKLVLPADIVLTTINPEPLGLAEGEVISIPEEDAPYAFTPIAEVQPRLDGEQSTRLLLSMARCNFWAHAPISVLITCDYQLYTDLFTLVAGRNPTLQR